MLEVLRDSPTGQFIWYSDRVKELIRLWEEGKPQSWIADHFGVSRNTIAGKLNRLRLKGLVAYRPHKERSKGDQRQITVRPKKTDAKSPANICRIVAKREAEIARLRRVDEQKSFQEAIKMERLICFDYRGDGKPLYELQVSDCRWPTDDAEGVGSVFACQEPPVKDCPYCKKHKALANVPSERPAMKNYRAFAA